MKMGTFSNNNYIPNIGQFNRPEMVGVPFVNPIGNPQAVPGYQQGTFTFAVPTQASQMTTVMSHSAFPRSLYSSHMPVGLAPGMGASWQHIVPSGMGVPMPSGMGIAIPSGVGVPMPSGVGVATPSGMGISMPSGVGIAMPSGVGVPMPSGLGISMPSGMGFATPSGMGFATPSGMGVTMPTGVGLAMPPGMGVSWQHTIPTQMPWCEMGVPQSGNAGVRTFTGMPNFMYTPTVSSSAIITPRPSCSRIRTRNKRRPTEDIEAAAPEVKVFLTEERMAHEMKNLSINNQSPASTTCSSLPDLVQTVDKKSASGDRLTDGYSSLKEIEDRLEEDIDDEAEENEKHNEGRLHLHESIAKQILAQEPILPKKILEDLNKPCLEVVLWKPPGGFRREAVEDVDDLSISTETKSDSEENDQVDILGNSSSTSLNGDMETEDCIANKDNQML